MCAFFGKMSKIKMEIVMRNILLVMLLVSTMLGCTTTQKSTATGSIAGAALGGIIGHQSGKDVQGAAIGGAIGALGGYAVGEKLKNKFCPQCGRTFDSQMSYCPIDGTELKTKQ